MNKKLLTIVCASFVLTGEGKKIVDYNGTPAKRSGVTLTPYSSAALIQSVTNIAQQGVLNQKFGGFNGAIPGTQFLSFNLAVQAPNSATAIAIDSSNNILLGGNANTGATTFAVARFLPSGTLDTSFNAGGMHPGTTYIPFTIGGGEMEAVNNQATGIALDNQGNILLGGFTLNGGGTSYFAVARFLPSGMLDTSFNPYGAHPGTQYISNTISGGGGDEANALAVNKQGNIILAGFTQDGGGSNRFAVAEFVSSIPFATDAGLYSGLY